MTKGPAQTADIVRSVLTAIPDTTASTATVFTCPDGSAWELTCFMFASNTGTSRTVDLRLRRSGSTFRIYGNGTVPTRVTYEWTPGGGAFYLVGGDVLQVDADGTGVSGLFHFKKVT